MNIVGANIDDKNCATSGLCTVYTQMHIVRPLERKTQFAPVV